MSTALTEHYLIRLEGRAVPDRALIGGKAWSIARLLSFNLPVPPAIVITTETCREYLARGAIPRELQEELRVGLSWLEEQTGRIFGRGPAPLLVSVRSGAPVSMPGMLDTVLNLGMNEAVEAALAAEFGDPAFAADTRRRFEQLYATIVLKGDRDRVCVPCDVHEQLLGAIEAVFASWNGRRARRYRDHHHISHDVGTAVVIQTMVFGNADDRSGTGVIFSRNPLTGEPAPYGEYLARAQGEDVVSGTCTPGPLSDLADSQPAVYAALIDAARRLEDADGDIQDIEFTVERGRLHVLQTRIAKRAAPAAARIAVDLVDEGRISPAEALRRISPEQVRQLLTPVLAPHAKAEAKIVAHGEAASPGIAVGKVIGDPDLAEAEAKAGADVVLARATTSPEDLHGMIAARAIVTELGGSTSHAAVVGRALGRPCVVGCGEGALRDLIGQTVTIDGGAGQVYAGALDVRLPAETDDPVLARLAAWAAGFAPLRILAQDPDNAAIAIAPEPDKARAQIEALPIGSVLSGAIFAADASVVRAAIAAGAATLVTSPILPALLAAVQAQIPEEG